VLALENSNVTIKTSGRPDAPGSTHCRMRCSSNKKNKINSRTLRSAPLRSRTWRSAPLPHAARSCPLLVSERGCWRVTAAQVPALLGASRDHCLPALSRSHHRAATYKHRGAAASGEHHMPISLNSQAASRCLC
jgi:hypothetical protein